MLINLFMIQHVIRSFHINLIYNKELQSQQLMFSLSPSDCSYLPLQISQNLNFSLPVPVSSIGEKLSCMPPYLQSQQTYQIINNYNSQLLFSKFSNVVSIVLNCIPNQSVPNELLGNKIVENINFEVKNDGMYANFVNLSKQFVSQYQNGTNNIEFCRQLLNYLLNNYIDYFGIKQQKQHYKQMIAQQIKRKSSSIQPLQLKINRPQNEIRSGNKQDRIKGNILDKMEAQINQFGSPYKQYFQHNQQITSSRKKVSLIQAITADIQNFPDTTAKLSEIQLANSTYSKLSFYEYHMLLHMLHTITPGHLNHLPKSIRQKAQQIVSMAIQNISINQVQQFSQLQYSAVQQLSSILVMLQGINQGSQLLYQEKQGWILIIVAIYKTLQANYDVYRRRLLKNIINSIYMGLTVNVNCFLNAIENNRLEILKLQNVADFVSRASSIIFDVYNDRSNFLKGKSLDELPNFRLVNLSNDHLPRKKVVNIWISGFLSQDMDKKSHWVKLTGLLKGNQIYAVQWSSDCITNLIKFIGKSCIDILTADKMKQQLKRKFTNNPFIPAMEASVILGRYLAEMIVRLFPHQYINITGYSLGSEMIKSCVQRLIQVGKQHMLNNIYMLGAVTDCGQMNAIMRKSKYPLCFYNCYTAKDLVLKHILSLCLPKTIPLGLNAMPQIEGHNIKSIDCTKDISGHLAYMSNYDEIGTMLGMDKD